MAQKTWNIKEQTSDIEILAKKCNISSLLCQILINRNIGELEFNTFLNPSLENLYSPFLLPDMEKAVARINQAVKGNEKIFIFGDYDVDGVTSLAIFKEYIKNFSGEYLFYIPHRVNEGYGLNKEAILKASEGGFSLIIAFDCGTNSFQEVELAASLGIDMVVIDHHHVLRNLEKVCAFINPKRPDSQYPFFDLSAAALSFKLLQALTNQPCYEVLDLVALSLVCDVVPLKGENRILLKEGLRLLKISQRPSIRALCRVASINQDNIDIFHIGFILGPRINASGRVAHAQDSLELFLSSDDDTAYQLAAKLQDYNVLRKSIESKILKEAENLIDLDLSQNAIVIGDGGWHAGVLGIIASRLADKYYRPCFIFSFTDGIGKGSGRSTPNIPLIEILDKCSDSLIAYGGHRKAAGLTIHENNLDAFRKQINAALATTIKQENSLPIMAIDLEINFDVIDMAFISELEKLKPFGEENPQVLFITRNVCKKTLAKKIPSGYVIWLYDKCKTVEAVIYDKEMMEIINYGNAFDIVYQLERNNYYNVPRIVIKDIRLAGSES